MKVSKCVFALLAIVVLAFASPAFAQAVTGAQQGTVVNVAYATRTPSQQSYQQQYGYNSGPSNERSLVGGALGGALALALAHHSRYGYAAGAAGAAIGYAVGHARDRAAYARQVNGGPTGSVGAQVIVDVTNSYGGHRTIAVFVPANGAQFYAGQKVWVVGNDELIPAN